VTEHLMLDFETLGQNPDAAVVSLGAVIFDKEKIIDEALWVFNLNGQLSGRRTASGDTIAWWMKQEQKARSVFEKANTEGLLLRDFVPQFQKFIDGRDIRVWGNGATFDVSIAEHILRQQGAEMPWKFWNIRCYRTMKACFEIDKPFVGTKHDALDDALHQTKCLMEYWMKNPGAAR
jgi:exodeoxyribonuclease VIII